MKITKSKLRRIIREEFSKAFDIKHGGNITSLAGADRYADHRSTWDVMREAGREDPEIERFFDSAAEKAEVLIEQMEDALIELEESLEASADPDLDWTDQFQEQEEQIFEQYQQRWNSLYEDHSSYVNVFNVPPFYYELVFEYMQKDGLTAREFSRKLMGFN